MIEYKVISSLVDKNLIEHIRLTTLTAGFPWYFTPYVAAQNANDGNYFSHYVYNNFSPLSKYFDLFAPILDALKVKSLIRIKINFFPQTKELIEYGWHADYEFPHKGAIIYLNDNDGFTIFEDGTKIPSVQNDTLFFDPSVKHRSTNCTNQIARLNVNLNYF